MLTESIACLLPIFPLPTVVLFPNVFLPLHIFEPRYRQMVADALAGDRIIGMVLLRPGYEDDYDGAPPIYATGCSGLITHVEKLEDGEYNLVLRGLEKFTIQSEEAPAAGRLYRSAVITPIEDSMRAGERDELRHERKKLQQLLTPLFSEAALATICPKRCPTKISSTRSRSISNSSRWKSWRCSNAGRAGALPGDGGAARDEADGIRDRGSGIRIGSLILIPDP